MHTLHKKQPCMKDHFMKLQLIAMYFMTYTISFFASQYIPRTQGTQTLTEMLQLENLADKAEVEKNKSYLKLSQKELNEWIKAKELEIKENQAKATHKINLKHHKEHVISYVYSEDFNIIKHCMLQNHRQQFNSPIKRITCYSPKLLLEYKK